MSKVYFLLPALLLLFPFLTPAADFDGDSRDDVAIFRPSSGLWSVRGVTRVYFGGSSDEPRPGDYDGDGIADIAVFRGSSGLWAIRGITRVYYGQSFDQPIPGGGGERTYDYVVKAGDGADLKAALESAVYESVYIPAGEYYVYAMINLSSVKRVVGEALHGYTRIHLINGQYLNITSQGCSIEGILISSGGCSTTGRGNFYINDTWYVTLRDCYSYSSAADGFEYTSGSEYVTLINCNAELANDAGFDGDGYVQTSRLIGCAAEDCSTGFASCDNLSASVSEDCSYGFDQCDNLAACEASGTGSGQTGFHNCNNITGCRAYSLSGSGFFSCEQVSSCSVATASIGFDDCSYISSCYASGCGTGFSGCFSIDSDSCNN